MCLRDSGVCVCVCVCDIQNYSVSNKHEEPQKPHRNNQRVGKQDNVGLKKPKLFKFKNRLCILVCF